MKSWSGKQIASLDNLTNRQIYLQSGTADTVVGPNPMNQLKSQLSKLDDAARVPFVTSSGAAHVFPTNFNGPREPSTSPYMCNCGYDGAGRVLKWMYGNLTAKNDGASTGTTVAFDQTGKNGAAGLDRTGYLYVPKACQTGAEPCKLPVTLHGWSQSHGQIGLK
ncbi:Uncharacterized protein TPAR_00295 [Tolypocladium paradoxum]|uniref:Uncharacterized protein n=1 Tax=Tolypocladium paradoxum TaxID=94208 RepID=A0A2S4LAS1_9HYPO|nr:Uncharacterized protein TPAR_00295 [Tolypocladium paradoxum]